MSDHRPFAVDQAEGLRQLFANASRNGSVIGFISAGRDSRTAMAIELIASRLHSLTKTVMLVDEQPQVRASLKGNAVLRRPMGAGTPVNHEHRHQNDLILVDAYPSRDSQVHQADVLVLVSKAPDFDIDTTKLLLKAISRAPQEICLLLTHSGPKMQTLACRKTIEDIAEKTFGRTLNWLGAIPTDQPTKEVAFAVDGATQRLLQLQPKKELADV